ncbi:hypothetical protein BDR05DRAFT_979633 [Suillus weaverae]|nr:hypothetical protein BDR05DRAFT_979633 [Suillus weaverae]
MTGKATSKRQQVLKRLRDNISQGMAIVGGGAGIGLNAKKQEAGRIDLIILYSSGSLAGLMPYGDANAIMLEMDCETLTVVKDTTVLAGICGTDPFQDMSAAEGVLNFPTVGLIDSETEMSYEKEVEMIRMAHEFDLLTTPYVFNVDEAERMAGAGADVIIVHMGLTTIGTIGAKTALALSPSTIAWSGSRGLWAQNMSFPGIQGFFDAGSPEQLLVESAMKEVVQEFKSIRLPARLMRQTVAHL